MKNSKVTSQYVFIGSQADYQRMDEDELIQGKLYSLIQICF